jgi:hypothetical protein
MREEEYFAYLRLVSLQLNGLNIRRLECMSNIEAMSDSNIKTLEGQLNMITIHGNHVYPRIMKTAREYLCTQVNLRNIQRLAVKITQLREYIQHMLNDISDYKSSKFIFPGKSRRKLAVSTESFVIVVFRSAYALSLLHFQF